jgi:hypothetical protein
MAVDTASATTESASVDRSLGASARDTSERADTTMWLAKPP